MTVDEEIEQLADNLRRLRIEYDTYFNGGMPRPPHVLVSRVEKTVNKYSSGAAELTFRQRYRFSQLAQSYFSHKNLWRRKMKAKEEGSAPHRPEVEKPHKPFSVAWSDPDAEPAKVSQLLRAIVQAKTSAGEPLAGIDPESFTGFIREKTLLFKQSLECDTVQFTVSVEGGKVKLRATKTERSE